MIPFNNIHFLSALFPPPDSVAKLGRKGTKWLSLHSEPVQDKITTPFFFFFLTQADAFLLLSSWQPSSLPSPSLSPHLPLLLWGSHCSSAGHKCIHRSFNSQLNQEDNPALCYLPCWDAEKLLKGGRDANWIHFPCDRVGCSLRTQHQQRLLGFFSLTLWLATVRIGTTLPASLEYQQSRRQKQQQHHHKASSLSEDGVSSEAARNLQHIPPLAPPLLPPPPKPHPCCGRGCQPWLLLVVMATTNGKPPD